MFYPGQPVYVVDEKRLGIYIGWTPSNKYGQEPFMFVFTIIGADGEHSDTQIYGPSDLRPIVKPDKKAVTGQVNYKSNFQLDSISRSFTEPEANEMKDPFLNEMKKLLRAKWFSAKYEINLEPEETNK